MFVLQRHFFSQKQFLTRSLALSFSSNSSPVPIQVRYTLSGYTNLVLSLPHQTNKIFYLNDKFTFKSLKEMFLIESPLSKIDIVYPSSLPLKDESNVTKFLKCQDSDVVQILIDGHDYTLSNDSSFESNRIMNKFLKKSENNKNSVFYWYQFCIENKIPRSNIGTISYFMRMLNHHLEKQGLEKNLSNAEIETIFKKILTEFVCPVNQRIELFFEKNNELEAEILKLENLKEDIEKTAKRRMFLYQKLIFLISLLQCVIFYYMIFHVEWLGWDIVEPITYTISQLTLVFGIRFFLKYGRKRDFAIMQEVFMNKIINKNRVLRDRYKDINEHLLDKRIQKKKTDWQIELLKNHRTYNQFLKQ